MIQEAYIQGISTRSVDELVKAMGMSGISKSQVSREICCSSLPDATAPRCAGPAARVSYITFLLN